MLYVPETQKRNSPTLLDIDFHDPSPSLGGSEALRKP